MDISLRQLASEDVVQLMCNVLPGVLRVTVMACTGTGHAWREHDGRGRTYVCPR
jgi:hypothetical protein